MSRTFHIAEEQKLALMKFNTVVALKKPYGRSGPALSFISGTLYGLLFTTHVRSRDRWTSIFL